jgi:hypothetical protein
MIVDVDSHWEATRFAPGEHPLQPWRRNGRITPLSGLGDDDALDERLRASFVGQTTVECFARTGDPLPMAAA